MMLSSTVNTRRALALLGVTLLLGVVAVTIAVPPAEQYEISIYTSFPWYYWVLVVGSLLVGNLTILTSALSEREGDRFWLFGAATVLLTNAVLVLMPYIRGYPMYGRADPMSHLGYIRIITETGVAGGGNIYPNTHLLIRIFAYATGLEPMTVLNAVAPAVTLVYFGSTFLLLGHVFESRTRALVGLPLILLPAYDIAHLGTTPFRLSILFVPFVLYLFVKDQQSGAVSVRAALAVALVSLVIYHPLTAVFLLMVFLTWVVAKWTQWFRADETKRTNIVTLLSVVFAAWYLNFTGMIIRFEGIVEVFLEDSGDAPINEYSSTISSTSPELSDLARIATYKYGVAMVLVGLGTAALALSVYMWWRDEYEMDLFTTVFGISMFAFAAGSAAFLLFDLIVGTRRPLQFAKMFGVILGGGFIYLLWRFNRQFAVGRKFDVGATASVVFVLLLLVYLATFTLYWSPLSSRVNQQVTEMELDGSEWLFENRDEGREIEEFGIRQYRFYHAMYGISLGDQVRIEDTYPPPHFNYTVHSQYGMDYEEDNYLILARLGRITYPTKFPNYQRFWRYTPEEFDRLERDRSVNRLYDNGDFTAYGVEGLANSTNQQNATTSSMAAPLRTRSHGRAV